MMTIPFPGTMAEPDDYRLFTLKNAGDMAVTISERGGALRSWRTPDRYGRMADVLLAGRGAGFGSSASPAGGPAGGRAGASSGETPVLWQGRHAGGGVAMLLTAAADGAGQRIDYRLDYSLGDDGSLTVDYHATARSPAALEAKPYPCFNLNGGSTDVGDHMLRIDADYYVEVDAGRKPVGVATVGGTPFDFRQPAPIGPRLDWPDSQTHLAGGFDHCFFVRSHYAGGQGALREVARVVDPGSGRCLQMYTTEAAVQFCAARRAAASPEQAGLRPWMGLGLGPGAGPGGFCLDANARPNLASAAWPQVILQPGSVYRQTTVYRLSLQE
ncbi:galactose-1-epimerase [Pseudoduganella sp. LjRoot289]|uniref:aldose epimerase family protein n=1 Tax=Pseudoduganella sp. LjRoot289 TaxID=3342314 RepID=UPI003ECD8AF9